MNTSNDDKDALDWLVLVNSEGQHSIWPVTRPVPAGWWEIGPEGRREEVLAFIEQRWTDMRPASLR